MAYCVRQVNNEKLRVAVYAGLANLLQSDEELFKFVSYAMSMNKLNNDGNPTKGCGRGMKKAISNWYNSLDALALTNMLGKHRGLHGWTHKDLITMCHVKFDENDEKLAIVKAMFNRGVKVLQQREDVERQLGEAAPPQSDAMKRLCSIFRLKICEDDRDAAKWYIDHQLEFGHIPSHMYNQPNFWDPILSTLNYHQLIKVFLTLNDLNMLKKTDELAKIFSTQMSKRRLVIDSGIESIQLLSILRGYEQKKRYPETVKVNICNFIFLLLYFIRDPFF